MQIVNHYFHGTLLYLNAWFIQIVRHYSTLWDSIVLKRMVYANCQILLPWDSFILKRMLIQIVRYFAWDYYI